VESFPTALNSSNADHKTAKILSEHFQPAVLLTSSSSRAKQAPRLLTVVSKDMRISSPNPGNLTGAFVCRLFSHSMKIAQVKTKEVENSTFETYIEDKLTFQ